MVVLYVRTTFDSFQIATNVFESDWYAIVFYSFVVLHQLLQRNLDILEFVLKVPV